MGDGQVLQTGEQQKIEEIKCTLANNLVQDILCFECGSPIKGVIVRAMNQTWHPEHFCCYHCKKPISGQKFNVEENMPYCVDDYSQLFLKRCQGCNLPIRDLSILTTTLIDPNKLFLYRSHPKTYNFIPKVCYIKKENYYSLCRALEKFCNIDRIDGTWWTQVVVVALNSYWHFDHFVCVTCGTRLSNNGFYERECNAFCQTCYQDKFCPKCKECNEPIMTTAVMALGEKWHEGCFKCTKCNTPISDPTFELFNGKQLCEDCIKSDDLKLNSEQKGSILDKNYIVEQ